MSDTVRMTISDSLSRARLQTALRFQNSCWLILEGPNRQELRDGILKKQLLRFYLVQADTRNVNAGYFSMRVLLAYLDEDSVHFKLHWVHHPPLCGICNTDERHPLLAVSEITRLPINAIQFCFRQESIRYNPTTGKGSCFLESVRQFTSN